jgi:uncharacterized membrane-anchored protein YhcB (DUF1043 family)
MFSSPTFWIFFIIGSVVGCFVGSILAKKSDK